jgi:hypothetical protein
VEPGEIAPELIDLPGIFVSRVVKTTGGRWQGLAPAPRPALRTRRASTTASRAVEREGIAGTPPSSSGTAPRESRRRHPHDGVGTTWRGGRDPSRRERRPGLRPDGVGRGSATSIRTSGTQPASSWR